MDFIRIFLVDDHRLVLEGLVGLIRQHPGMTIIGTAADGKSAVEQILVLQPDIVLMDISMPALNGLEATRLIAEACPSTKVLILSMHDEKYFLSFALEAGAIGYLLKDSTIDELYLAIELATQGISYISPALLQKLVVSYLGTKKKGEWAKPLLTVI